MDLLALRPCKTWREGMHGGHVGFDLQATEIGNLLPNNQRQRRTHYALCHILFSVSAAHTRIFRMDSNSTSYSKKDIQAWWSISWRLHLGAYKSTHTILILSSSQMTLRVNPQHYLTESACKVVSQKSIPAQIRQLILDYY